jgi:ATP-dependent helicase/nuclease subunit B
MSLRFIYGRAGSGKTTRCLEEIKARLDSGAENPLVLLVPEQFTFQAERDLIRVLGRGGILKTEVLSFRRLAFRVFNDAGGITGPHIHSAGKCMILYEILDKRRDSLRIFARSADRPGFVNTLSSLITEFKRYGVAPACLEAAGTSLGADDPLKEKLAELYAIYAAFEKTLEERYRDSDDDLTLAAEKLDSTGLYTAAEIWLDGFAGFTPQEYGIVGKLLRKAARVNVSLCTDSLEDDRNTDGTDIFSAVKRAFGRFKRLAGEYGAEVEPPVRLDGGLPPRFRGSPELAHLERNLYAYPYKVFKGKTGDISLFSSVNIFSEIEAAARDIVRLCRDEGMRYRDIAVVTRNLSSYEKLIEVIFEEYGIPCFIDRKVDIVNHPLVRMILSMLEIFIENWSYEAVFRYLKTGLTGIDRDSVDRLENYVLACGIRGSRWTGGQDWTMSPELLPGEKDAEEQSDSLAEINRIRREVSGPLLEFRKSAKGRRKASEICGALYDFLCAVGVPGRIEESIDLLRKDGRLSLAGEYSQVWNTVMEVFDQTVEVMGDETFGLERFSDILKIGFGEYRIGLIPASMDQVLVGSVERSKSHEIKALYILGANDGVFPASASEEGILSDRDREALAGTGIELASDTRSKAFDEQYLVYRALTTAGSRLRISWPIADHEGRTMRPSIIIPRLRRLFPHIKETSNLIRPDTDEGEAELATGRIPAFRQMTAALRRKADGADIRPLWKWVYLWFSGQEDWRRKCRSMREAFLYRNLAQPVGRRNIALLYGDPARSSVSRLEKYTACPFAYYVQYGLGARERKIYRLSPPDVGTFMHAAIERFSKLLEEKDMSWREFDREWCAAAVSEIIDGMLDNMQGSGIAASKRYTALALRLKRVVARAVWLIAGHIRRGGFDPIGFEIDFEIGRAHV